MLSCPTAAARLSTVTVSESFSRSSATSTVISFVIEAIGELLVRRRGGEHLAGVGVLDEPRMRFAAGGAPAAADAANTAASDARRGEEAPHRRRMRSPMKSAVGTTLGLSCWSRVTETPVAAAIVASVSPARTV